MRKFGTLIDHKDIPAGMKLDSIVCGDGSPTRGQFTVYINDMPRVVMTTTQGNGFYVRHLWEGERLSPGDKVVLRGELKSGGRNLTGRILLSDASVKLPFPEI